MAFHMLASYLGLSFEYLSMLMEVLRVVDDSCQLPSFVSSHNDLLIDTTLLLWENVQPIFSKLHSHQYSVCRQFLTHEKGMQVHVQVPMDMSVNLLSSLFSSVSFYPLHT